MRVRSMGLRSWGMTGLSSSHDVELQDETGVGSGLVYRSTMG